LYDGLGTTRALTDTVGAVQEAFNYTPFGEATGFDPESTITNHLFTGEAFDDDLGQYYLRARMYDPAIGRFTASDPADDFKNKLHKYLYCANNPINYVDPSGCITVNEVLVVSAITSIISGIALLGSAAGIEMTSPGSIANNIFALMFFTSAIIFQTAVTVFFSTLAFASGPAGGAGAFAAAGGGGAIATTVSVSAELQALIAGASVFTLVKQGIILLAEAVGVPEDLTFQTGEGASNPGHGGDPHNNLIDGEARNILGRDGKWFVFKNKATRNPGSENPWAIIDYRRADIFAFKFEGGKFTQFEIVEVWPSTQRGIADGLAKKKVWEEMFKNSPIKVTVRNLGF
jgi:RHS repeat-associated protein